MHRNHLPRLFLCFSRFGKSPDGPEGQNLRTLARYRTGTQRWCPYRVLVSRQAPRLIALLAIQLLGQGFGAGVDSASALTTASQRDQEWPYDFRSAFHYEASGEPGGEHLSSVIWTGRYFNSSPQPPTVDVFTLRVYEDEGGRPGVMWHETLLIPPPNGGSANRPGHRVYRRTAHALHDPAVL